MFTARTSKYCLIWRVRYFLLSLIPLLPFSKLVRNRNCWELRFLVVRLRLDLVYYIKCVFILKQQNVTCVNNFGVVIHYLYVADFGVGNAMLMQLMTALRMPTSCAPYGSCELSRLRHRLVKNIEDNR